MPKRKGPAIPQVPQGPTGGRAPNQARRTQGSAPTTATVRRNRYGAAAGQGHGGKDK